MCFSCVGWRGDKPWGNARNFSYFSIWFLFVLGFLSQARRSLSAVLYKTALRVYVSTESQTLRGSEKKTLKHLVHLFSIVCRKRLDSLLNW